VDHFGIKFDFEERIQVNTLDEWVQNQSTLVQPPILKLDVEGHELSVLTGGKEMLKKIQLVQFEFGGSNIDARTYFQDFWYFFADQTLISGVCHQGGPLELSSIQRF
jgi:hypothetical protein